MTEKIIDFFFAGRLFTSLTSFCRPNRLASSDVRYEFSRSSQTNMPASQSVSAVICTSDGWQVKKTMASYCLKES